MLTQRSFSTFLAVVLGLTAASASAAAQRYGAVPFNPSASAPILEEAFPAPNVTRRGGGGYGGYGYGYGDGDIRSRLESTAGLVIAGQKLRGALLRQFYATHGFEPVWDRRQPQADALLRAVLRAGEHGLDPDLFHGTLLKNPASLPPIDRELLLSDAFLAYADALSRGAVPIETRMDEEALTPEPVDVVALLNHAMNRSDPAAAIEAVAPRSPTYMALRRALQAHRSGEKVADARLRGILVNLERQRWLPRQLPADRVWVDIVNAQTLFYQDHQPVFTTRVIVGAAQKEMQSPEMQTTITSLLFNPPWNVPQSIASKQILPKLKEDPNYLARSRMIVRPNGGIQQLPGAGTALGLLKFEMTNRFDVYLHDTPSKALFSRDNRRLSNGCVRVQNPRELAALLLQQPVVTIDRAIALGTTNRGMLPAAVPVFLVYQTAVLNAEGSLVFRPDVYERDDRIWRRLIPARQAPVADNEPASQRRS